MNELIKIDRQKVGGEQVQTVNARDLHAFLGVGKDFSNWIKDRIAKYGFVENQDFVVTEVLRPPKSASAMAREQKAIDYHLTLGMAKEISMVERNAKGKQARLYFIECERIAKQPALPMLSRSEALRLAADMVEKNESLQR